MRKIFFLVGAKRKIPSWQERLIISEVRAVCSLPRFPHVLDLGQNTTKVPALKKVTCSLGIGSSHIREFGKFLPLESGMRLME